MEQQQKPVHAFKFFAMDLAIGTFTSGIQLVVGYPLDFVKTRMQVYTNHTGGALCHFKCIIKDEGVKNLYRGMTSPLMGSLLSGSMYYSSYELARRFFADLSGKTYQDFLPFYQVYLAGSFSGLISDIFNIPLEYSKIQIQKEYHRKGQVVAQDGPFTFLMKMVREQGVLKIYKGSHIQIARDLFGCGWFFTAYDFTLRYFAPSGQRKDVSQLGVFAAGAGAGIAYWTMSYPIDVLKTKLQSDDPLKPKYKSVRHCAKEVFAKSGYSAFYKGYFVTVFRSVLVNTVGLQVYENLHRVGYNLLE